MIDEDLTGRHTFSGVFGLVQILLSLDKIVSMIGVVMQGGPDFLLEFRIRKLVAH
jgi:hypothetical protein